MWLFSGIMQEPPIPWLCPVKGLWPNCITFHLEREIPQSKLPSSPHQDYVHCTGQMSPYAWSVWLLFSECHLGRVTFLFALLCQLFFLFFFLISLMLDLRFLSFLLKPSKKPPNGEDFFSLLSATCSPLLLRCPLRCLMGQLTLVQGQLTLIQGQPSTGEPCWVFTPWHHLICVVLCLCWGILAAGMEVWPHGACPDSSWARVEDPSPSQSWPVAALAPALLWEGLFFYPGSDLTFQQSGELLKHLCPVVLLSGIGFSC